ncbi:MAG: DUF885 domain-containing protein [Bacteroidota bacterium]
MKLTFKRISAILILALLIYAGVYVSRIIWFQPSDINVFFDRYHYSALDARPELLSEAGHSLLENFADYHSLLTDVSPEGHKRQQWFRQDNVSTLKSYETEGLSIEEAISRDVLLTYLQNEITEKDNSLYLDPLSPQGGIHTDLIHFLSYLHPVTDYETSNSYRTRIRKFEEVIAQIGERLDWQEEKGFYPSRFQVEADLAFLEKFAAIEPLSHPLYHTFAVRATRVDPTRMNEYQATEILESLDKHLAESLSPALSQLQQRLSDRLEQCPDSYAKVAYPAGFFASQLGLYTDSTQSPEALHTLLTSIQQQTQSEADSLLASLPTEGESRGQRLRSLPHQRPDERSENMLKELDLQVAAYRKILQGLFGKDVFGKIRMAVDTNQIFLFKRVAPSMDKSRRARLLINPSGSSLDLETELAYHALPGHFYRQRRQRSSEQLPEFRRMMDFPAFNDGWALYAMECLDKDLYMYENDPQKHLANLQFRLDACAMARADWGLHQEGWTEQQAMRYLLAESGLEADAAQAKLLQMMAHPGEAFAGIYGLHQFKEIRRMVSERLGDSFYPLAFHQEVLRHGSIPFPVLRKALENFIQMTLAS